MHFDSSTINSTTEHYISKVIFHTANDITAIISRSKLTALTKLQILFFSVKVVNFGIFDAAMLKVYQK